MRSITVAIIIMLSAMPAAFADPTSDIDTLLDAWHVASAEADADAYFGAMTEDCIFLGTDATERWLRDELRTWAEPYFAEAPAWAFTVKERNVYVDEGGEVA